MFLLKHMSYIFQLNNTFPGTSVSTSKNLIIQKQQLNQQSELKVKEQLCKCKESPV